ncbi:phosphate ABC transporter substrate-binding protein PstS [Xylanimonas protaetiae]|uniref:Phosphate-binding protein n=1 Tax=Xylanimonas protaetiae TaxID=2509457 RepID=A0A4P6FMA6_9MICO|nr:phosphate ABC transporter substrate-binding protein PstS [Xylanimonas protaetiae]
MAVALAPLAGCGTVDPTAQALGTDAAPTLTGTFQGSGATSQQKAMEAWIAGFTAKHPDVTLTYDGVGSGAGRKAFLSGEATFGTSDVALSDEEMAASGAACDGGNAIDLPVYISPIAVAFNVPGVTSLHLSSTTVAGLLGGDITSWDDDAVAADNPGVALPALRVVPVHRSESSGTTENFTDWLHATAPRAWPYDAASSWPLPGGTAAEGTGGVVAAVAATPGAVTYADASQVGTLGTASIRVGDQWVASSAAGAAGAAAVSPRDPSRYEDDLSYDLDRTATNPNVYPLVLVSYLVVCSRYADRAEGEVVKEFVDYVASDEGQSIGTTAAGSAPLSPAQQEWLRSTANDIFLVPAAGS